MTKLTPHQQFKNAHRSLLNRWVEESDIDDLDLAKIAVDDTEEWLDEEVIDFESEVDLDEA